MPASHNYLSSYFEDALQEIVECLPLEDQREWYEMFFDDKGKEVWEGIDNLKDQVQIVLHMLDIEDDFSRAVFRSIDFHDLMDRIKYCFIAFAIKNGKEYPELQWVRGTA